MFWPLSRTLFAGTNMFNTLPVGLYISVFLFGTVFGSFLNVIIFRLPQIIQTLWEAEEENDDLETELEIPAHFFRRFIFALEYIFSDLVHSLLYLFQDFFKEAQAVLKGISFPGSQCGHCHQAIRWYDNIPVLSWFILRGKCRHCQTSYSFRYPLVEALTGLLFILVLYLKGFGLPFFFWLPFIFALWGIFWIDLDTQFVFNVMTYPSIFLGILYNVTIGNLKWALMGAMLAWLMFESIMFLSIVLLRREGMGGGDVKLAILLGIWLGPVQLLIALALAFILGTLVGIVLVVINKESKPFPFGPFLVIGAVVASAVGEQIWTWYIDKSIS